MAIRKTYLMQNGVQLQSATINTAGSMNYNRQEGDHWRINAGSGGNFSMGYYTPQSPNIKVCIRAYCVSSGDSNTGWLNMNNWIGYVYGGNGNPKWSANSGTWYTQSAYNVSSIYVSGGTNTNWLIYDIWYEEVVFDVIATSNPSEGGSFTGNGTFSEETTTQLEAIPNAGYEFVNWKLSGYTQLEYIESTGTQYIDTLVSMPNGFIVDTSFMPTQATGTYIVGSHNLNSPYGRNGVGQNSLNNSWELGLGDSFPQVGGLSINTKYHINASTIKGNSYLTVDDTTLITSTDASIRSSLNVYVFSNSYIIEAHAQAEKGRLYYLKLYDENNILVRDFIPVIRHKDGTIGLLDLCELKFYSNSGSGSFVSGAEITDDIYVDKNPLNIVVSDDIELEAFFRTLYTVNIEYDNTLGHAYYEWLHGNTAVLHAEPNESAQFLGWYYDSEPIGENEVLEYQVNHDITLEARFERIYDVNVNAIGNGAVQVDRQTNKNIVVVSVIPAANWSFGKYVINGEEFFNTPLPLALTEDITLDVYFIEDDRYHISATTNVPNGTVYVSNNDDYSGYSSTLWARPIPNYVFDKWQDGNTENPRTITVTQDIILLAEYTKVSESNNIYQYRCFVKDQLDLTAVPKAFMIADSFTIRRDLMTNANSSIAVLKMASNVNNGDVLVLYNPKGDVLYNGVITSIKDNEITCSQMQSYYKGEWIYNNSPKATLEEEIAFLIQEYADGKIFGSTYIDPLVSQRLGGITIDYVGSTNVNLPSDKDEEGNIKYTTEDMESFIYSLYENYGVIFDFEINFSGANYVHIKVPTYEPIKVGNNMYAIQNMAPIETIEETNRLIVFSADHQYRKTYVATKTGIVEEPSSTVNRFNITNTVIVNSDDELSNIVASSLPTVMYNHKLNFDLILKNFIYEFGEFRLGMPLDVWHGSDYYNSVLTGFEMAKASNQNVTRVAFICGKVRKKLTQLLTLKRI